ncbi:uncharacterized protein VTP21DRAFT_10313 [Calcarisporiella thermophila]|uniref:uncharacterized protein n=1 Tax=Calcarisporiella thermophila TaxID=911321 RepID=UPI003742381A
MSVKRLNLYEIQRFYKKPLQHIHKARCHIPRAIAYLVKKSPQLVAPAVEAFYIRDPIALKACHKMEKFPPDASITTLVPFTRIHYAKLMGQKFYPPKPFHLPPTTSPEYKAAELGMKLACGFEMLCSDVYNFEEVTNSSELTLEDELVGSKNYRELEQIAREQFLRRKPQNFTESPPNVQVARLLSTYRPNEDDFSFVDNGEEDDDSWIILNPKEVEDLWKSTTITKSEKEEESDSSRGLAKLAERMQGFIQKESIHEGAEFPDESTLGEEGLSDEETESEEDEEGDVNFDEEAFLGIMKRALEYKEILRDKINVSDEDLEEPEQDLNDYMLQMDQELADTMIGKSFDRPDMLTEQKHSAMMNSDGGEINDDEPVDIDFNLVKNMLESFKAQEGLPGPAGNMMGRLGVWVPRDEEEEGEKNENRGVS